MSYHPELTEGEWALILGLLQRELSELPTEIHHTYRAEYRHDLEERRKVIERLLERLSPQHAA